MVSVEALVGGTLRATYLVPIALSLSLVARHGRYLPLWVPQCGMMAAYVAYGFGERLRLPAPVAILLGIFVATGAGLLTHRFLFARYVNSNMPYPALLRGLALIVIAQGSAALATDGYALSFNRLAPTWSIQLPSSLSESLGASDVLAISAVVILAPLLWLLIQHTQVGLTYRAVSSNRGLAGRFGLPVRRIDWLTLTAACLLSASAGVVYGLRYGLTPEVMTAPTLKAVAVVVAVGSESVALVPFAVIGIGLLEAVCQSSMRFSAFETGVSYAVLVASLLIHYVLLPAWRRLLGSRMVISPIAEDMGGTA